MLLQPRPTKIRTFFVLFLVYTALLLCGVRLLSVWSSKVSDFEVECPFTLCSNGLQGRNLPSSWYTETYDKMVT